MELTGDWRPALAMRGGAAIPCFPAHTYGSKALASPCPACPYLASLHYLARARPCPYLHVNQCLRARVPLPQR
jgi:hypothetical protein